MMRDPIDIEWLPEADMDVWHHVISWQLTEAIVMGTSTLTRCGKRLTRVTAVGGRTRDGAALLPVCPACETIGAVQLALIGREELDRLIDA